MGEMIEFERPDGGRCPAYLAKSSGVGGPSVVVIQEWWGLNDQIKRTADRFAEAGLNALAPDLFRGKGARYGEQSEASHLMSGLNFIDAAEQDVRGALSYLKRNGGKAAVSGFCMGGALTIIAAAKLSEVDAGACFYGIPPAAVADPAHITVPMIYHFATRDDWCVPPAVDAVEAATKAAKAPQTLYRYDAEHAFMNDARPEVYDAAAAKLAWDRTVQFLRESLR
jgi:carboxymethylenebutenolidase